MKPSNDARRRHTAPGRSRFGRRSGVSAGAFGALALSLLFVPLSTTSFLHPPPAAAASTAPEGRPAPGLPPEIPAEDVAAMRAYSGLYDLDYRLVLAVAEHESRFDRSAVSPRGATGMLQIMPSTGRELSEELDLSDVTHPAQHLRAGIYYLAKLAGLFTSAAPDDRTRLALAAYNAGPSRIYDAQELAAYLGEDPDRWSSVRHVLPLLSRRYASLHARVWPEGRPPHGYSAGWRETVRYVDRVMATYERHRSAER